MHCSTLCQLDQPDYPFSELGGNGKQSCSFDPACCRRKFFPGYNKETCESCSNRSN